MNRCALGLWYNLRRSDRRSPEGNAATEHAEETQLLARARVGDLDAFNCLVDAYQDQVYGLCVRMLGSPDAAADAAQEAFLAAFRHLRSLRGEALRPWLLRIAANAATSELRRRRRRPSVSLDAPLPGSDAPLDAASPGETPEDYTLRRELGRTLTHALATLPADQRLAVILVDIHGLGYEEAAAAMDTAIGTVKSRVSRGRERLRGFLLAAGELPPSARRLLDEQPSTNRPDDG